MTRLKGWHVPRRHRSGSRRDRREPDDDPLEVKRGRSRRAPRARPQGSAFVVISRLVGDWTDAPPTQHRDASRPFQRATTRRHRPASSWRGRGVSLLPRCRLERAGGLPVGARERPPVERLALSPESDELGPPDGGRPDAVLDTTPAHLRTGTVAAGGAGDLAARRAGDRRGGGAADGDEVRNMARRRRASGSEIGVYALTLLALLVGVVIWGRWFGML